MRSRCIWHAHTIQPPPCLSSLSANFHRLHRDPHSLVWVQFRRDTVPALQELIQPVLAGPPPPLTDTVTPQQLADPDSRFLEVDGVTLHYMERGPTPPDTPVVVLLHGFNGSVFNWCALTCCVAVRSGWVGR